MPNAVRSGPASGSFACPPSSYAPAGQTQLTINTTTMAAFSSGNACTGAFTAPASGSVLITLTCVMQTSAAGAIVGLALAAVGTVTPLFGPVAAAQGLTTTAITVTAQFPVTGLTPGQSYQFDLLGAVTTADTAVIFALGGAGTALGAKGAPVIMTVQVI